MHDFKLGDFLKKFSGIFSNYLLSTVVHMQFLEHREGQLSVGW